MGISSARKISIASAVGFIATAVVIIALPLILIKADNRSDYFFVRIIWTEFLALLVWGYFGGFITLVTGPIDDHRGLGGVLPALGLIVTSYAAISFLLMLVQAFIPDSDILNRIHMACQILLTLGVVIICVFLYYSRVSATVGTEPIPDEIRTPNELCALLRLEEDRLSPSQNPSDTSVETRQLHDEIKGLREKIKYSLQHVGSIGRNRDYKVFAESVEDLCSKVSRSSMESDNADGFLGATKQARALAGKIELIVESLKRN